MASSLEMDPVELYEELSRDLGFGAEEAALLRRAQPLVEPHAPQIVDRFYEVLSANPTQRAVFDDEAQIERQKVHLRAWIVSLFDGEYDAAYVQRRARIGRAHVRIRLPQRYMVSMMNLLRRNLRLAFDDEAPQAGWSAEEIRRLWCALDQLLDIELAVMLETFRDDYDARLRTSERLASLGKLAASIGHELRNPLAVIDSSTHLLARRCDDDPKTTKHIDRIREQVARSNHIITDLLELARDRPPVREPIEIGELVHLALTGLPRSDRTLRTNVSEGSVVVDGSQLRQVIFNLVQNALQAARSWVQLDAVVSDDRLRVVVTDDGPGFTLEAKANLFEPLYTTKVNGVGLGLWLSKRIVEKHGGVIQAQSLPEGGAKLELDIPAE